MKSRNSDRGFAERTKRNLEAIEKIWQERPDEVHVVTQVTLSMLGFLVLPTERKAFKKHETDLLLPLASKWVIAPKSKETTTLGDLLEHVRNGVCHSHIQFEPANGTCQEVRVLVEDGPPPNHKPFKANWWASISCPDLREFVVSLIDLIEHD